jgi:hypothetical protein
VDRVQLRPDVFRMDPPATEGNNILGSSMSDMLQLVVGNDKLVSCLNSISNFVLAAEMSIDQGFPALKRPG